MLNALKKIGLRDESSMVGAIFIELKSAKGQMWLEHQKDLVCEEFSKYCLVWHKATCDECPQRD